MRAPALLFFFLSLAGLLAMGTGACGSDTTKGPPLQPGLDGGDDGGEPPDAEGADVVSDAPDGSLTPGSNGHILLVGTILTPDAVIQGQVLVEGTTITCVEPGTACAAQPGAAGATVIDTGGSVIAPGLVDTHNHILFDVFDDSDWLPAQVYQDHDQWPNEPRYKAMLDVKQCLANDSQGKPAWCANTPYGTAAGSLRCELDKWGELKGLIAGTTSIVGLPGTSSACFGSLARSMGVSQNGLPYDHVQTSALFPPSNPSGVCANFANKTAEAFLVHCGEGLNAKSLAEFSTLGSSTSPSNCLFAPQTAITHATAFTASEFTTMGQKGMKLTWSPASNVALYKQTTQIPLALDAGVLVAIAPDWSMGGSQNMLDELRFADAWDDKSWNNLLKPKDLVGMATVNGAKILALDGMLGQIKKGYLADLAVFAGDANAPYDAILAATPKEVRLVMIGGVVLYGDPVFKASAQEKPPCETIDICGSEKFLCVATADASSKLNQTYADIKAALEKAMTDADAQTPTDGFSFAPLAPLVKCR